MSLDKHTPQRSSQQPRTTAIRVRSALKAGPIIGDGAAQPAPPPAPVDASTFDMDFPGHYTVRS